MSTATTKRHDTTVLHVGGLRYATEKNVVEQVLGHRPGVLSVDANPVAQTATVTFDPQATNVGELRLWVQECGYRSVSRAASVVGPSCRFRARAYGALPQGLCEQQPSAHVGVSTVS